MMILVCFDIEDDKIRRDVANKLSSYGNRVQRSVFEILVKDQTESDYLFSDLLEMISDIDEMRFYPICRSCLEKTKGSIVKPGYLPNAIVI